MKKILTILLLLANNSNAEELFETNTSVRALGMGNAYAPIVNDSDSVFYNPAGLCKVNGINWKILNPSASINGTEAYQNAQDAQGLSGLDGFDQFYGTTINFNSSSTLSAVTLPCFGVVPFANVGFGFKLDNPAFPNLFINSIADGGVALGLGFDLTVFSMALSVKQIRRAGIRSVIGLSSFSGGNTSNILAGTNELATGYGADLGINFMVPIPSLPTFSFVWKNLGQTTFAKAEGATSAPPSIQDEMTLGFGMELDLFLISIAPVIEYKYMNRADVDPGRKVHAGLEFGIPFLDIRAGFSEGYYTLGVGLDLWLLRLDVATYGVELGEYPGQHEDRRIAAQMTMELGFDPSSFSFLGSGDGGKSGPRRRVKRRR